jgi:NTE family protein
MDRGMSKTKRINLALQGGGSHGAYTWGALDALLEDTRIEIAGVSGASAGAMNAVVMAFGLLAGGRAGARQKLAEFWRKVSEEGAPSAGIPAIDAWVGVWKSILTPPSVVEAATESASPYEFNPLDLNPLEDTLSSVVDFSELRKAAGPKLFIAATNVFTGKVSVFHREELTPKHVMASACLPHLFQAVVIDGEPHWDGGYSGNPPLWPLFYETDCQDNVIVQINPIERLTTPKTAEEINNRTNEITFNIGLLAELRAADFVARLIEDGVLKSDKYKRERLHRIGGDGKLESYSADTKLDVSWTFLQKLRDLGRDSAKEWLAASFDKIGVASTLDLGRELRKPAVL